MNKTFFDTLLIIILVFLLSLLFASFIKKLYINEPFQTAPATLPMSSSNQEVNSVVQTAPATLPMSTSNQAVNSVEISTNVKVAELEMLFYQLKQKISKYNKLIDFVEKIKNITNI